LTLKLNKVLEVDKVSTKFKLNVAVDELLW